MVKWDKIKIDYITNSDMSLRDVAKKHGVSTSVVARKSAAEGWAVEKERYQNESVSISLEKIMERQAERRERVQRIADRILDKIEQAVEELDMVEEISKVKETETTIGGIEIERTTESVGYKSTGSINRKAMKTITASLKDLKDVQMLQSALDERKQAVQLELLEKQKEEGGDTVITAAFRGAAEAYSE